MTAQSVYNILTMNFQSPSTTPSRSSSAKPTDKKVRSLSTYDRHIRPLDKEKYSIRSVSPTNSTSSYHSELEQSLIKTKPVRQYAIDKNEQRQRDKAPTQKVKRSAKPIRKFKIKGWEDDFYSNLLDWSYNNYICAASHSSLFFYNMDLSDVQDSIQQKNCTRAYSVFSYGQKINSIHFSPTSTKIALGYTHGTFINFDYFKDRRSDQFAPHNQRVSCIQWYGNNIFTGSKDQQLRAFDARTMQRSLSFQKFHDQEICGVKAYSNYLATGGNDNCVAIFDIRKCSQQLSWYKHQAAVKALDWSIPNMLISGGGNGDRMLKLWKDGEGIIKQIDTGSQVCGIIASTNSPQIFTCQGFSLNQAIIWNMKGRRQLTVHAHQKRVLFCALSPGGQYVATGAGDERVKVWKFFEGRQYESWANWDIR